MQKNLHGKPFLVRNIYVRLNLYNHKKLDKSKKKNSNTYVEIQWEFSQTPQDVTNVTEKKHNCKENPDLR